jgi:hypothetical protein
MIDRRNSLSVFRELLQNADDAGVSLFLKSNLIRLTGRRSMFKSNSIHKPVLMLWRQRREGIWQDHRGYQMPRKTM